MLVEDGFPCLVSMLYSVVDGRSGHGSVTRLDLYSGPFDLGQGKRDFSGWTSHSVPIDGEEAS